MEIKNCLSTKTDPNLAYHFHLDSQSGMANHSKIVANGKIVNLKEVEDFIQITSKDLENSIQQVAPDFSFKNIILNNRIIDEIKNKDLNYRLKGISFCFLKKT